jgi:hypothetical protein
MKHFAITQQYNGMNFLAALDGCGEEEGKAILFFSCSRDRSSGEQIKYQMEVPWEAAEEALDNWEEFNAKASKLADSMIEAYDEMFGSIYA